MDDVNGLTDSRADDLLDRSTQFRQFDDVNNLDGRASHGRADYYVDDDLYADDGYDSCAYGQCSRKVEKAPVCSKGQCGRKQDSCAYGQCGVKEDLDHNGIVHGGDRRIRSSYGYGSYGRRSYGGYAY